MQVLGQLGRLPRPCLAHHNHHRVVTYDVQQLLTDGVDGEVFALLLQRLGKGELCLAPLLVHLHVVQKAGVFPIVCVVLCILCFAVIRLEKDTIVNPSSICITKRKYIINQSSIPQLSICTTNQSEVYNGNLFLKEKNLK